jgi:two-component system, chemotaxis family, sensor histidine kinase and response regulator PixL
MLALDPDVRDQAYQFFRQEAQGFLQLFDAGLPTLRQGYEKEHIHDLMQAAYSIKKGAAAIGLAEMQTIAQRLETVLRAIYHHDQQVKIDAKLEGLLLQIYQALKEPLTEEIQTHRHDGHVSLQQAEQAFAELQSHLGDVLNPNNRLPTTIELGIDIVHGIFTREVHQVLERLERLLNQPELVDLASELQTQAEFLIGVGGLVNLPGFTAIAQATKAALMAYPDRAWEIGNLALADLYTAQEVVLDGDRIQGGSPSDTLQRLAQAGTNLDTATSNSQPENLATDAPQPSEARVWANPSPLAFGNADEEIHQLLQPFLLDSQNPLGASLAALHELSSPELSSPIDDDSLQGSSNASETRFSDAEDPPQKPTASSHDDVFFDELEELLSGPISGELIPPELAAASSVLSTHALALSLSTDAASESGLSTTDADGRDPSDASSAADASSTLSSPSLQQKLIQILIPTPPANADYTTGSVRVDLSRLQRINNLMGELFTQENGSILQVQNLRSVARSIAQRFSHFEQLNKELQDLADQHHNMRAKLQTHQAKARDVAHTLPLSMGQGFGSPVTQSALNLHPEFDPLQMDSYDRLHLLMQEVTEQIAHLGEAMQDIGLVIQQVEVLQRQRQQTLKQVRTDLLRARMLPVSEVLQRFPRMVRDLCAKYDKQVDVKLNGIGTLVDKAVLEKLFDPLVHLVRNAFDHGIEMPDVRQQKGKPRQATIEIRAYHRGNQTYIEVRDDGKGIDANAIRKKAVALQLIDAQTANKLPNDRLYEFLFTPGFSTASQVTELSGRGVGLDAVRSQIGSLKGSITLASQPGKGTTFTLRFPLTLSIAKLLVFSVQSNQMAIPSNSLAAIVMAPMDSIQTLDGQPCYCADNQVVPLYPTAALLKHYPSLRNAPEQPQALTLPQEGKLPLLLISSNSETVALQVDQILQEQEYVIKPFGSAIVPPSYLYGCTVLGDGSLVPVIDGQALIIQRQLINFLALANHATPETEPQEPRVMASSDTAAEDGSRSGSPKGAMPTILVVDDSLTARQFLALSLEKANYRVIQARDGREALQQLQQIPEIGAIFCDVEMPRMNGFEFLNACQQEFAEATPPVIMLTSRSSEKHRQIAHKLGASGYLTKPYLEHELLATLQTCLA